MENRNMISGMFLILLSIGTCIMAYRLGLGTGGNPGAGFAAFGIAFLLGLMSIALFGKSLIRIIRNNMKKEEVSTIRLAKPFLILVILAGYGVLFNILGFSLATFLLMLLLVKAVGGEKLTMSLIVSAITVVLSYALFVLALGLPLPEGSAWYRFGG